MEYGIHANSVKDSLVALQRHKRTVHTDLKPFNCDNCDKSFGDSGNLKRHERITHLMIRYPCPDCQRECLDKGDLSRHRREKHGETPLLCKHCGLDYRTFYGLTQHINTKHAEVPTIYPCDLCDKKDILTSQQRSQHKVLVHGMKYKTDSQFQCNICKNVFLSKPERSKHMEDIHKMKNTQFSCVKCGKKEMSEIRLGIHMENCTKKQRKVILDWTSDDSVPVGWKYQIMKCEVRKNVFFLPPGETSSLNKKQALEYMKSHHYIPEDVSKVENKKYENK